MTESTAARDHSGVVLTNDDAAECKLSAVSLGYYKDPFVHHFVRRPLRKPPLINRGHYARVGAIDSTLRRFLLLGGRQVVVLGCGYDTTFFRVRPDADVAWYDVDLPQVARSKADVIRATPELNSIVGAVSDKGKRVLGFSSANYHIAVADLTAPGELEEALGGLDKSLPTIFISECVMVYLRAEEGDRVIRWAAQFAQAVFVTYEPFRPDDAFGARMVQNLRARGCPLLSVDRYPDADSQRARYVSAGFSQAVLNDMNAVYKAVVASGGRTEAGRLARLEMFDELEEWQLILAHYFVLVASKPAPGQDGAFWTMPTPPFAPAPCQ